MTTQEILIVVFGLPSVTLLSAIYHKMGKIEGAHDSLKENLGHARENILTLWTEINKLKEQMQ